MGIAILGATGSVGQTTARVARFHGLEVSALVARRGTAALAELAATLKPSLVSVADAAEAERLRSFGLPPGVVVRHGATGVQEAVALPAVDTVVVAVPGLAGLEPTLSALAAGRRVLTANKESLVAAGPLLTAAIRAGRLVSVDSEHAALAQLLAGRERPATVVLTASGGPFWGWPPERLADVGVAEALRHPSWRMGPKITVDSATLLNKGFEVIEAHVLFDLPYDVIEVLVHPQSVVHALVRYADGVVLAQMSVPDMALPIQWALFGGERRPAPASPLDLAGLALSFERAGDHPAIRLAADAGRRGGGWPAALSAANEEAVAAFLDGRLAFADIIPFVVSVLGRLAEVPETVESLVDVMLADRQARVAARSLLREG